MDESGTTTHPDLTQASTIEFGPLTIAYDSRVLVPRPWTQMQSQWAADLLEGLSPGPVLELCTGAGHIGLLALALSGRSGVLVDIDPVAAAYARRNAEAAGLTPQVEVRLSAAEEALRPGERFVMVVADPPWVPSGDVARFPEDPLRAIDGGDDGLAIALTCLAVMGRCLTPDGVGLLQVGTGEQVHVLQEWLARDDTPGLRVEATRTHEDRGVVVLLRPLQRVGVRLSVSPSVCGRGDRVRRQGDVDTEEGTTT